MKVLHLSEKEATIIAIRWAEAKEGKAHENFQLWSFIKEICRTFDLNWREDAGMFARGV
jgi:hypothetical protein